MASDSKVNQAASAATGAAKSALGGVWDRVTPFKLSGLYTSVGVGALLVGGAWAFAPAAMAASAPLITAPTAAAASGSALSSVGGLAATATNQLCSAVAVTAKGVGNMALNANWSAVGAGFKTIGSGLTGNGVTVAASSTATATGATATGAVAAPIVTSTPGIFIPDSIPL